MSNPNGSSSREELEVCLFFTSIKENGELEVSKETVRKYSPDMSNCIEIPVFTFTKGEKGTRISESQDVYAEKRGKIVRIPNRTKSNEGKPNKEEKKLG